MLSHLPHLKVEVYAGKHQRALRKGSQPMPTLARAPLEIKKRATTETCHAQRLAVKIRVIWLVGFSVEVILPSLVQ